MKRILVSIVNKNCKNAVTVAGQFDLDSNMLTIGVTKCNQKYNEAIGTNTAIGRLKTLPYSKVKLDNMPDNDHEMQKILDFTAKVIAGHIYRVGRNWKIKGTMERLQPEPYQHLYINNNNNDFEVVVNENHA